MKYKYKIDKINYSFNNYFVQVKIKLDYATNNLHNYKI